MNPLEKARNRLDNNRFGEFFATLSAFLKDKDRALYDDICLLASQYQTANQYYYRLNQISFQEYTRELSRIQTAARSILDETERLKNNPQKKKRNILLYFMIGLLFIFLSIFVAYFINSINIISLTEKPQIAIPPINTSKPSIIDTVITPDTTPKDKPQKPPPPPPIQEPQATTDTSESVSVIIHLSRALDKDEVIIVDGKQAKIIKDIGAFTKKILVPIGPIGRQVTIKIGKKCRESVYIKPTDKEQQQFYLCRD